MNVPNCPICQEAVESSSARIIVTCCGNIFHTSCLRTALKYDQRCPLCRKKLGSNIIFLRCKNPETGHTWTIGVGKNGTTHCSFPYWIK